MFDAEKYRARIAALATLDPTHQIFGAMNHHWSFQPTLSELEVQRFEGLIGADLPADYRAYLTQLGNGGAGPYYGIGPLAEWEVEGLASVTVTATMTTKDGETKSFTSGTGARPPLSRSSKTSEKFVLTSPWKVGDAIPEGANPFDGCVHLAQIGCGYEAFLVVKGEAAGTVWEDYTAGDGAIAKVADSFGAWLTKFADIELAKLVFQRMESGLLESPFQPDPALVEHADVFGALFDEADPISLLERALCAAYLGEESKALEAADAVEVAIDLAAKPFVATTLGAVHLRLGNAAKARALTEARLAAEGLAFQTRGGLTLARALAVMAMGEDASEAWAAAREAKPFELSLRVWLAFSHLSADRVEEGDLIAREAAHEVRLFDRGQTLEGNALKRAVYERLADRCDPAKLTDHAARYRKMAAELPTGPSGWGNPGNTKSW